MDQYFLIFLLAMLSLILLKNWCSVIVVDLKKKKKLLHSLGLVYKSMRGMMTNSIDRDQWLNVTSESRDRI
jgi:hypothetical protein